VLPGTAKARCCAVSGASQEWLNAGISLAIGRPPAIPLCETRFSIGIGRFLLESALQRIVGEAYAGVEVCKVDKRKLSNLNANG
jgi:hypothetical protein